MWRSVPQTPQAATRMSAALGGTSGFGTSRMIGGSPGPSKVVTRTVGIGPPPGSERGGTSTTPTQRGANRPAPGGYSCTRKVHNSYTPVNPLRRNLWDRGVVRSSSLGERVLGRSRRKRENRLLLVRLVPAHHVDRAMRVPNHRLGDASYEHPLYRADPPAAQHDRPRAQHAGKPDDLFVRSARPEVRLGHLPAFRPDPLGLLLQERAGVPLGPLDERLPDFVGVGMGTEQLRLGRQHVGDVHL